MEPEHLKQNETIDIASIPISVTAYSQCGDPRELALIEPDLLATISRLYSRNVIYPLITALPDKSVETLERFFSRADVLAETSFMDCVTRIAVYLEHGGVEHLRDAGFDFTDPKETPAHLLNRALIAEPKMVFESVRAIAESKAVTAEKTWHVFKAPLEPSELKKKLAGIKNDELQGHLKDSFVKDGYGTFCEISGFGVGEEWGRSITHGCHRPTKPMLDLDEKRAITRLRPMQTDMIFALPDTSMIWIGCPSGRGARTYADRMGTLTVARDAHLLKQDTAMSIFLRKDLAAIIGKATKEVGVYRIELKHINIAPASGGSFGLPSKRNACLTERYHEIPQVDEFNTMRSAKLRVYTSKDEFFDFTVRDGSIKTNIATCDPVLVSSILARMQVWKLHVND